MNLKMNKTWKQKNNAAFFFPFLKDENFRDLHKFLDLKEAENIKKNNNTRKGNHTKQEINYIRKLVYIYKVAMISLFLGKIYEMQ